MFWCRGQVSRDQGSKWVKDSRSQGSAICPAHSALCAGLAETDDATAPEPVDVKPEPAQVPLVAVPAEARDETVAARILPDSAGEDEVEALPALGDLARHGQHALGVTLAGHVSELLGSGKHDLAVHIVLAILQELGELQGGRADEGDVFQRRPTSLAPVVNEVGRERKNHLVHCLAFL